MPTVDVLIPVYNAAAYLAQAVASVLDQDVDGLRIVLIDNASTDGSAELGAAMAAADRRIEVVRHPENLGAQASFNEAIDLARGDYMMILCADDFLTPGALGLAVAALETSPRATFAIGADLVQIEGQRPLRQPEPPAGWRVVAGHDFIEEACRSTGTSLALGAVLARTSVQKRIGHYRPEIPYTDDLDMALRMAVEGDVVAFDAALGIRREHAAQQSATRFSSEVARLEQRFAAFDGFFSREGSVLPDARRLRTLARRRLAVIAYRDAVKRMLRGSARTAAAMAAYAFKLSPSALLSVPVPRRPRPL
ncbi:MAG: glycosyltransferase family 2 protein [Aestuariivirgaceae bacterium]